MKDKTPYIVPIACGVLLLAVVLFLLPDSLFGGFRRSGVGRGGSGDDRVTGKGLLVEEEKPVESVRDLSAEMLAALRLMLNGAEVKPNEAILEFKDADALKAFLARADKAGLKVLGTLDKLNMVRVGYDDLRALRDDMRDYADGYSGFGANYYVHIPEVPAAEDRPQQQQEAPFGDSALAFMGVKGNNSTWGKGITIAILDSGISSHPAFAAGRVRSIDIGMGLTGTTETDGHATAVASLAGGAAPGATGVAPASTLLSIRVTNSEGTSDMFTLAQGIQAAVDAGAQVINISLGAYQDSSVLSRMIGYAQDHGSVIVAAGGNDQTDQLTWPAADPRVISVGAVGAGGEQVSFSNSGENLSATAPGLGVNAAWPGEQSVSFDGTSGSSPLMAGAIAAVLSINPNLTAQQAAALLTAYSADAGAPGHDPAYGFGTVDIGYALNFNNPAYTDPAISSQYFNADASRMEFIVQNRSGDVVTGLRLNVNAAGEASVIDVPNLKAGEVWSYIVGVDQTMLDAEGQLAYVSQLRNPPGIVDQNAGNNRKASIVYKVGE